MIKRYFTVFCAASVLAAALAGCGGSVNYADGTYEGKSSVHEGNGDGDGYGVVSLTISDNTITGCEFSTYQPDGTLKDEDYGKQNGEVANADFYNKAQRAVLACQKYAEQLAETGNLDDVDAVSGATISYDEFKEAVNGALSKAKE